MEKSNNTNTQLICLQVIRFYFWAYIYFASVRFVLSRFSCFSSRSKRFRLIIVTQIRFHTCDKLNVESLTGAQIEGGIRATFDLASRHGNVPIPPPLCGKHPPGTHTHPSLTHTHTHTPRSHTRRTHTPAQHITHHSSCHTKQDAH